MSDYIIYKIMCERMSELGLKRWEYHFETFFLPLAAFASSPYEISAYNQYYFLSNPTDILDPVEIISDTGYYNSAEPLRSNFPEFSGKIQISRIAGSGGGGGPLPGYGTRGALNLEFIRVILR